MDRFNQLPEEKRLRIINAALSEFGRKGYQAASTIEIAKHAAISKGSLFHYFGSKEKLYQWLLAYSTQTLEEALYASRVLDGGDLIESLTQAAVIKLKVFAAHPYLKDFLYRAYQDEKGPDPFMDDLARGYLGRYVDHASAAVDENRLRSDLTLLEAIQTARWVLDGMVKDHLEAGLPLDDKSTGKLTTDMLTILKKLLYKEDMT